MKQWTLVRRVVRWVGVMAVATALPLDAWADPVAPVRLGSSSNGFDGFSNDAHRVAVDAERGVVVFVHSQDRNVFGGSSFRIRADVSLDGGVTFANDLGPLDESATAGTTVPSAVIPRASTEPWSVVWAAVGLNSGPFREGVVSGEARGTATTADVRSESWGVRDLPDDITTLGSLTEGADGEYWGVIAETLDPSVRVIHLVQGVTGGGSGVEWRVGQRFEYRAGLASDGDFVGFAAPAVAFSPDGTVGWVAWLGAEDNGGEDNALHLMVSRSLDSGATWTTPLEVPISTLAWVGRGSSAGEALFSLGVDVTGRPTATGELDLTVDGEGQVHVLLNVANAVDEFGQPWRPDVSVGQLLVDVVSSGTEFAFTAYEVAFLNTHDALIGSSLGIFGDTYVQGNRPQLARDHDGTAVFYAWTDSPLASVLEPGGPNVAPALFVSAMNAATRAVLPARDVTGTDLIWANRFLLWTMGPVVLDDAESFRLPIVAGEPQIGVELTGPVTWWWFGNDATIARSALGLEEEPDGDTGMADVGGGDVGDTDAGEPDASDDDTAEPDTGDDDTSEPDAGDNDGTVLPVPDAENPGDDAALADAAGDGSGTDGTDGESNGGGGGGCSTASPVTGTPWAGLVGLALLGARRRRVA